MKLAMIKVDRLLLGSPANLVITVHDELVIETDDAYVEECKELVVSAMSGITLRGEPILSVPLMVACDAAPRWSDAK
jgi:DNA polymerase-1